MSGRFNLNDYVTVDERIDRFWEKYPHGAIRTELLYANNDGSSCAIKASVYKDASQSHPDASGIAQEESGNSGANKTSWWENCETSAIGRALANMGMSISKQRPSREEMAKVQRYQDDDGNAASRPAPAPRPQPPARPAPTPRPDGQPIAQGDQGVPVEQQPATERQVKFAIAIAREAGLDDHELNTWSQELYNREVYHLNRRDCSALIEALQRRRNEVA